MMNQQKGFSLIEVVLSLILTTTLTLLLLQLQNQARSFLKQTITRIQACSVLDRVDEELLLGSSPRLDLSAPYFLYWGNQKNYLKIQLSWENQEPVFMRSYQLLRLS